MSDFKNIILCADDFGLNSGISQGILKLARRNRLTAVSCMVNAPDFLIHAPELLSLNKIQTGLHFNLTEGYLISEPKRPCFNLNELIMKTHSRFINSSLIVNEFNAQLKLYLDVMGDYPRFIDGHQHVHQFPIIRNIILEVYEQQLKEQGVSIRSTYPALTLPPFRMKAMILARTGGIKLRDQLKKSNIPHNSYFSGVYNFAPESNYRNLFRQWLSVAPENTLIMCHPGEGEHEHDPISRARSLELDYFLSEEFLLDCQEYQIRVC